jgi:hypothetical protein
MIDIIQSDTHQIIFLQDMTEYGKAIDSHAGTVYH